MDYSNVSENETVCEYIFKKTYNKDFYSIRFDNISIYEDLPLNMLNFNNRTKNILNKNEIFYLSTLLNYEFSKLLHLKNMGVGTIQHIEEQLHKKIYIIDKSQLDKIETLNFKQEKNFPLSYINTNTLSWKIFRENYNEENYCIEIDGNILDTDISLELFNFNVRTSNVLNNNEILYLQQLLMYSIDDLSNLQSMGKSSIDNILIELKKRVKLIDRNTEDFSNYIDKIDFMYNVIFRENIQDFEKDIKNALAIFIKEKNLTHINMNYFKNNINLGKIISEILKNEKILYIIKQYLYKEINKRNVGISKYEILTIINFQKVNSLYIFNIIDEMLEENMLMYIENKLFAYVISIFEYISTLDEKSQEMISFRLEGETLEEIGRIYNITRERVRQIVDKKLFKQNSYKEDFYSDLFKDYQLNKNDFIYIFKIEDNVYNYLAIRYSNKNATNFIEDIILNDDFPKELRNRAEQVYYKNYIKIDNTMVKHTRNDILEYYIYTYCKNVVNLVDLSNNFNKFILDNNIVFLDEDIYVDRYFETKLSAHKKILWQFKKNFRYYDFDKYDKEFFFEYLNLQQYEDFEISSQKIFNDSFELMEEYNILNEYELHNLLKKHLPKEMINQFNINFSKMPTIKFGECNREKQVQELLRLHAPIDTNSLTVIYEEKYGFKATTTLANYFKCIEKYLVNGIYTLYDDNISLKVINDIKGVLIDDFYFIDDAFKIIKDNDIKIDVEHINGHLLRLSGYRIYTNYIISEKFSSSSDYFRAQFQKDFLDFRYEDSRLHSIQQRYSILKKLEKNLDIIEFEPRQFISFNRFRDIDITKSQLFKFSEKAYNWSKEDIFTIHSLKKSGFYDELFDLGFDDLFYSSIIKSHNNLNISKIGSTILFGKGQQVQLLDLITSILDRYQKFDIFDLLEYISENYGIVTDKTKILTLISGTSLYYSRIMEKIYIDYDMYYEEV